MIGSGYWTVLRFPRIDNGSLAGLVDDNGNRTVWTYDAQGRKTLETKGGVVAPALASRDEPDTSISYTYYDDGLLASRTKDDGLLLEYAYDDAKRLTDVTVKAWDYGQEAYVTTGEARTFEYDGANRVTYSHDANTANANDDVRVRRYYDSLGRLVEEGLAVSMQNNYQYTSYEYDSLARAATTYPNGRVVELSYYGAGMLAGLADDGAGTNIAQYEYIGARTLRRTMENGVDLDLRDGAVTYYDAAGRPERWAHVDTNWMGERALGLAVAFDEWRGNGGPARLWRSS